MSDEERRPARIVDRLPAWARRGLRAEVILAAVLFLALALFAWYRLAERLVATG
jgi:hypothetical protein